MGALPKLLLLAPPVANLQEEMGKLLALPLLLRLVIADPALPPGSVAPPVLVQRADGGETRLDLKGRAHLLVFFTTWCRRCPQYLAQLPRVSALKRRGVALVPIDLVPSELPGDMDRLWRRLGRPVPLYLDRYGQVADAYGVSDLPTTVLVGGDGRIRGALIGARTRKEVERLLDRLEARR